MTRNPWPLALGYRGENPFLATESFLKDYFRQALQIYRLSWNILDKCLEDETGKPKGRGTGAPLEIAPGFSLYHGRLTLTDANLFESQPPSSLEGFRDHPLPRRGTRSGLGGEDFRRGRSESTIGSAPLRNPLPPFFLFSSSSGHLSRVLEAMYETGFLSRFLEEFDRVHCQVQYDRYHIYPVDVHSLYAVREIENLEKARSSGGSVLEEVMSEIQDPGLLKLAALFHDLGKGEGSPHTIEGEKIAASIGKRLSLSPPRIADLCFLVREHLNFVEIAHRRDLNDENLIFRFARSVENGERLKMLYLLCVADLRAVGPAAWTAWKDALMRELFLKTLHLLEKGEGMGKEIQERTLQIQAEVMELLRGQIPPPRISVYLVSIPSRHYAVHDAREIGRRFSWRRSSRSKKSPWRGRRNPKRGARK